MHHHKTYMYFNFQQKRASTSVKTVYTNLFANNRKLPKYATINSTIRKNDYFRYASSCNVRQFSANSG